MTFDIPLPGNDCQTTLDVATVNFDANQVDLRVGGLNAPSVPTVSRGGNIWRASLDANLYPSADVTVWAIASNASRVVAYPHVWHNGAVNGLLPHYVCGHGHWTREGSPYKVAQKAGETIISPGASIVVDAGAVVAIENSSLTVVGDFDVAGSPSDPAVFTSYRDNATRLGDLNGDGLATQPAPGDWGFLGSQPTDDASVTTISHAVVRYGGGTDASDQCLFAPGIVDGTRLAISDSDFGYSVTGLVSVNNSSVDYSRFHDARCGGIAGTSSGSTSWTHNIFDASIRQTAFGSYQFGPGGFVTFTNNETAKPIVLNDNSDMAVEHFVVSHNNLLGGVADQAVDQDPNNLKDNWWGHTVPPPGLCRALWTYDSPAPVIGYLEGCPDNPGTLPNESAQIITGYFTAVYPACDSPCAGPRGPR
jgi:hypothetical protein